MRYRVLFHATAFVVMLISSLWPHQVPAEPPSPSRASSKVAAVTDDSQNSSVYVDLFDGKTLKGWRAADMSWWSVEDGAITATITAEKPCKQNQYLFCQQGVMHDFELKLVHRIISDHKVNGGFQFRSEHYQHDDCKGYQVDNNTKTPWLVRLYDEFGRHTLAWRGERAHFGRHGQKTTKEIADAQGAAPFDLGQWHEYHLTCQGTRLSLRVNDQLVAEVIDDDPTQRDLAGLLALQLHSGPPMKVQFKDIRYKQLAPAVGTTVLDDLSAWRGDTGTWETVGDVVQDVDKPTSLVKKPGRSAIVNGPTGRTSNLISHQEFADVNAHIEFMIPQGSNSGVYFMGRYEIQIYDSHGVPKGEYPGIECGGIYQRWNESRTPPGFEGHSPRVNAARAPGEWQSFDVVFRTPRFDTHGRKISNARFESVLHNGVAIHKDIELTGPTRGATYGDEESVGPLMLQGDHGPVAYRNIRISAAGPLPFFAMDTGTRDAHHETARDQVTLVSELGYEGIGCTAGPNLAQVVEEADKVGLRVFTAYAGANIDAGPAPYGPELVEAIELLQGRNAILWLYLNSTSLAPSSTKGDENAVRVVRKIAKLAAQHKVRVALYPHHGLWVERVEDAVRLAEKVDRNNVGVTFNLCHWLRTSEDRDPSRTVQLAMPHLFVVTVNGADHDGENWKQLIQTLDGGSFDTHVFLKMLLDLGYNGPIGLQGFGIGGDVRDNLERSMTAWQQRWQQIENEKVKTRAP